MSGLSSGSSSATEQSTDQSRTFDRHSLHGLALVVIAVSAAVVAAIIVKYGVSVPAEDEIAIGDFLLRNHDRIIPAPADLFAQHNESRKFFPRLIFFYLARMTGWNLKWQMAVSLLMACATVAVIWRLAAQTAEATAPLIVALASLLILSPVQWWNWLLGIQIVAFTPTLMLVCSLAVLTNPRRPATAVAVAAAACLVATYSYANGMLLWFVLVPAVFATAGIDRRRRVILTTVWIIAGAATVGLYFDGYVKPRGHPPLVMPFDDLPAFASYCLAFLGHPIAWAHDLRVAAGTGTAAVAFVLLCLGYAVVRRDPGVHRAVRPWAILGAYAVASAGATAAGRLRLALEQSLEPRYTTFAIPLWVSAIALTTITLSDAARRSPGRRAAIVVIATAASVALVALHLLAVRAAWPQMQFKHRERRMVRALVQLALVNPDRSAFPRLIWHDPAQALRVIDGLDRIGYLSPRVVRSPMIAAVDVGSTETFGATNGVQWRGRQGVAWGWAGLPAMVPADTVLLARRVEGGDRLVAVATDIALRRDDIGEVEPSLRFSGWRCRIRENVPPGTLFTAWAYDSAERRAYPLSNPFVSSE